MSNTGLEKADENKGMAQQMTSDDFRLLIQNFQNKLNTPPKQDSLDKTADGRAQTVLISHIEMTLDEYFFGLWSTENFKWERIANEIVGTVDLVLIHPSAGITYRRTGAAAIQITVDAVPEQIRNSLQEKNMWAQDTANKKPNALDMGFPKLKAECVKNAAQSLGQIFGRDLNRKKSDEYKPLIQQRWGTEPLKQENHD